MKTKSIFLVLLFVALNVSQVEAQKSSATPEPLVLSAREIAAKVMPSVVLIITQDENGKPIGQGSGFVYQSGLVVSNLHVFERASRAVVKNVNTGESSSVVEVVAMNAIEDICIVRIENNSFPVLKLGDSASVQTGDEIFVAGNPKGLEGTFSKGIISSIRNSVGLIQIDAAISPGSSGGVLVNAEGLAVGIIKSSIVSGQNLNFAIPINKLKALRHRFHHPVILAGACAYSERSEARLKGNVLRITETFPIGSIVEKRISKFDLAGNIVERLERTTLASDKPEWSKSVIVFDESGLRVSAIHSSPGTPDERVTWTFEEAIKNKIEFRKFSKWSVDSFSYNSAGEELELNASFFSTKSKFDRDLRELERRYFDENGELENVTRFSYKDDNYGNWVEMLEYNNFPSLDDKWELSRTTTREIEYYH